MATGEDIRIEVRSDPKLLRSVRAMVRGYLETQEAPTDRADSVVLAVDEACANAIRHSYQTRTDRRLTLSLRSGGGEIEIVLSDDGIPAPPERLLRKKPRRPDRTTVSPGGLGVQLMYDVFDEVEFCPGPERGNRVTMRLKKSAT